MTQLSANLALGDSEDQQSQTSDESAVGEDRHKPGVSARATLPPDEDKSSIQITTSSPSATRDEFQDERGLRESVHGHEEVIDLTKGSDHGQDAVEHRTISRTSKRPFEECAQDQQSFIENDQGGDFRTEDVNALVNSQGSSRSARSLEIRSSVFNIMSGGSAGTYVWDGLISTTNNHTYPEAELGEG